MDAGEAKELFEVLRTADFVESNMAKITSVDELCQRAVAFLRKMGDSSARDSLVGLVRKHMHIDQQNAELHLTAQEVHLLVRERLYAGAASTNGLSESNAHNPYWVNRCRAPHVTEEEIDAALECLTSDERRLLEEEFDMAQNDGFYMVDANSSQTAPVSSRRQSKPSHEDTKEERTRESEEDSHAFCAKTSDVDRATATSAVGDNEDEVRDGGPVFPTCPDDASCFFAGSKVEVTFDFPAWNTVMPFYETNDIMYHTGASVVEKTAPDFNIRFASEDTFTPVPHSVPHSVPPIPPPQEKAEVEALRWRFVRSRVHEMLLANRVVADASLVFAETAASLAAERRKQHDKDISLLLEQLKSALCEAVLLTRGLQELNRAAMGDHVRDPYRRLNWQRDGSAKACNSCGRSFIFLVWQHHCRRCGLIYCHRCSSYWGVLPNKDTRLLSAHEWQRLCKGCYDVCCAHQKLLSSSSMAPRNSFVRNGSAPEDPALLVLMNCPNPDGTLKDKLPPFYVVLPDSWYTLKSSTALGWLNTVRGVPYLLAEGLQDGATNFSNMALPTMYHLMSSTGESVRKITG